MAPRTDIGLKVYAHALEEANAARAAADGVDVLAHTPTEALSDATLEAWKTRTVISTLSAFGGVAAAVKNLHDLRARGARVLYGTDLGNTRDTNIQAAELSLLAAAGLRRRQHRKSQGTSVPAEFLGLSDFELRSDVGKSRELPGPLAADPTVDPHTLSEPIAVYVDGMLVSAGVVARELRPHSFPINPPPSAPRERARLGDMLKLTPGRARTVQLCLRSQRYSA